MKSFGVTFPSDATDLGRRGWPLKLDIDGFLPTKLLQKGRLSIDLDELSMGLPLTLLNS